MNRPVGRQRPAPAEQLQSIAAHHGGDIAADLGAMLPMDGLVQAAADLLPTAAADGDVLVGVDPPRSIMADNPALISGSGTPMTGRVVCAADTACMSKTSPLAVALLWKSWPYQEATPVTS